MKFQVGANVFARLAMHGSLREHGQQAEYEKHGHDHVKPPEGAIFGQKTADQASKETPCAGRKDSHGKEYRKHHDKRVGNTVRTGTVNRDGTRQNG